MPDPPVSSSRRSSGTCRTTSRLSAVLSEQPLMPMYRPRPICEVSQHFNHLAQRSPHQLLHLPPRPRKRVDDAQHGLTPSARRRSPPRSDKVDVRIRVARVQEHGHAVRPAEVEQAREVRELRLARGVVQAVVVCPRVSATGWYSRSHPSPT